MIYILLKFNAKIYKKYVFEYITIAFMVLF